MALFRLDKPMLALYLAPGTPQGAMSMPENSGELNSYYMKEEKVPSVLSQTTSVRDFKKYFAVEAFVNDHMTTRDASPPQKRIPS